MRKLLRTILPLSLALALAACNTASPTGSRPGGTTGISGNNSATLTGATIGTGVASTAELRKTLDLTLATPHPDLELGPAYLTRFAATGEFSEHGSLTAEITNTGSGPVCFVRADDLTYRSADATLVTESLAYVYGSVGRTESGVVTATCLGAGESGYFIDFQYPDSTTGRFWSDATRLEIGSLTVSTSAIEDHGGRLGPIGYSVAGSDFQSMTVTGENQGSIVLYPNSFAWSLLLDDAGEPLEWFFLNPPTDSLAVGQTAAWTGDMYYEGAASRLRVSLGFDTQPQTTSLGLHDARPLTRAEFLELRNRALSAHQEP